MAKRVASSSSVRARLLRCAVAVIALAVIGCRGAQSIEGRVTRFVSLSPAITETLFAVGAGPRLVGVSDYCHFPGAVERLPHLGSGYTPRYEAIIALRPTAVFVEQVNAETTRDLAQVLKVEALPWLTLEQVVQSTRRLGAMTDQTSAAERLALQYEQSIRPRVSPSSPRVLLVLAHPPGQLREVWFIRRNSIHGRILEAAGAVNAAKDEVNGPPHLSLEQVLRLDPEGIVILQAAEQGDPRLVEDWMQLGPLTAVRRRRIELIAAPALTIPGPRIIELAQRLSPLIQAWRKGS